jgi:hypothetical protein
LNVQIVSNGEYNLWTLLKQPHFTPPNVIKLHLLFAMERKPYGLRIF